MKRWAPYDELTDGDVLSVPANFQDSVLGVGELHSICIRRSRLESAWWARGECDRLQSGQLRSFAV